MMASSLGTHLIIIQWLQHMQRALYQRLSRSQHSLDTLDIQVRKSLRQFTTTMVMHAADDFLLCRCFRMTLAEQVQAWLDSLPPGSIFSFKQLRNNFLRHFKAFCTDKKKLIRVTSNSTKY